MSSTDCDMASVTSESKSFVCFLYHRAFNSVSHQLRLIATDGVTATV